MLEKKNTANTEENNNNTNFTNQPVLIFHRSKENTHEAKITQEMFLLDYNRNYPYSESIEVIDYVTGDHELAHEINEIILGNTIKSIVIVNSSIPAMEYDKQYDMYSRFCALSNSDKIELYFMDSRGRLFKEVKNLGKDLEPYPDLG